MAAPMASSMGTRTPSGASLGSVSAEMGIRSIPTLILLKGGVEVARQSGALPLPQLLGWLRQQAVRIVLTYRQTHRAELS